MEELYYMDRGENQPVFVKLKKNKNDYTANILFKSGVSRSEKWTNEDYEELLESQIIFLVKEIDWNIRFDKPKKRGKK
jgi:hypothetical protein